MDTTIENTIETKIETKICKKCKSKYEIVNSNGNRGRCKVCRVEYNKSAKVKRIVKALEVDEIDKNKVYEEKKLEYEELTKDKKIKILQRKKERTQRAYIAKKLRLEQSKL